MATTRHHRTGTRTHFTASGREPQSRTTCAADWARAFIGTSLFGYPPPSTPRGNGLSAEQKLPMVKPFTYLHALKVVHGRPVGGGGGGVRYSESAVSTLPFHGVHRLFTFTTVVQRAIRLTVWYDALTKQQHGFEHRKRYEKMTVRVLCTAVGQ